MTICQSFSNILKYLVCASIFVGPQKGKLTIRDSTLTLWIRFLGSGENADKMATKQGAWLKKTFEQGTKEINLGCREQRKLKI